MLRTLGIARNMADGFMATLEEHPYIIGGIAVVVVLIALMSRGSGSSSNGVTFQGEAAPLMDPNAAAIQEAGIAANSANLSVIASLLAGEHSTDAALTGSLAETSASRDVALSSTAAALSATNRATDASVTEAGISADVAKYATSAALTAHLADTSEARDTMMAQIEAFSHAASDATSAGLTLGQSQTAANLEAARISADTAAAQIAANAKIAAQQQTNDANAAINKNQTDKDIARAQDNTSIVNGVVHVLGTIAAFFGF